MICQRPAWMHTMYLSTYHVKLWKLNQMEIGLVFQVLFLIFFLLSQSFGVISAVDLVIAWTSCQIRKITGAHAPGMPGTFSPPQRVSDPDMHYDTCVTHVPWCMPGSLTSGFLWSLRRGKMFPAFPAHAQPVILCIWQEAHGALLWLIK